MNIGPLAVPPFLEPILPILRMAGLDPAKYINAFGRKNLGPLLLAATPATVKRLTADGWIPALKDTSDSAEVLLLKSTLYDLIKEAAMSKFGRKGLGKRAAGLVANFWGDEHLKGVVVIAGPQVDATSTVQEMVDAVRLAFLERVM